MSQFFEAEQQLMVNVLHGSDLTVGIEDLSQGSHRVILGAARELFSDGITPDLVTIHDKLKKNNRLQDAGGASYLAKLMEAYPVKNVEPYENIVREGALRKRIGRHAQELLMGIEEGMSGEELLAKAQRDPLNFLSMGKRGETFELQDYMFEMVDEIRSRQEGKISGLQTPWYRLNDYTNGLQPGDLIIVAGRPSMGKTALATQIATHAAQTSGPVFIGSLEMSKSSLCERILSAKSRIDSNRLRSGKLSHRHIEDLVSAAEAYQDYSPILVNDTPRLTPSEVRLLITKAYRKYNGLSCAVVDYLGLMDDENESSNRVRNVGLATKLMRATAKELNIPVVLVCQLNRSCEMRDDKRPTLKDLRESGEIEQDADVVVMLYRDEYYCNDCSANKCERGHSGEAEVLIRKQRNGPIGAFTLTWIAEHTTFHNFSPGGYIENEGELQTDRGIDTESVPPLPEEDPEEVQGDPTLPF